MNHLHLQETAKYYARLAEEAQTKLQEEQELSQILFDFLDVILEQTYDQVLKQKGPQAATDKAEYFLQKMRSLYNRAQRPGAATTGASSSTPLQSGSIRRVLTRGNERELRGTGTHGSEGRIDNTDRRTMERIRHMFTKHTGTGDLGPEWSDYLDKVKGKSKTLIGKGSSPEEQEDAAAGIRAGSTAITTPRRSGPYSRGFHK